MIRSAVVGVGYLGSFHADKWKALSKEFPEKVNLQFVFDKNKEQSKKISEKLNVKYVTEVSELIGSVDAVTIATSTPSHYELAKLFLKNGIHVLVEKPMSLSAQECSELCDLAKAKNLALAVGHSERYNSAYTEFLKRESDSRYIEMKRWAPFKSRGSDVSVIYDLLIHDLDLLINMSSADLKIKYVDAGSLVTETEDWISVGFSTKNLKGNELNAHISIARVHAEMQRSFISYSPSQSVFADLQNAELKISKMGSENIDTEIIKLDKQDHLYLETRNFLNSIYNKEKINVSGTDGLRAAQVIDLIHDFIRKK